MLESENLFYLRSDLCRDDTSLDIVVLVVINGSKWFLDEFCQLARFNMAKIHVGVLLNRKTVKTRSLSSMKTQDMRVPVEFGYEIESNWYTKELQGVWQPGT